MTEFSILRQKAGLTVSQAATRLGYTEREIYRWENGEVKPRRAVLDLLKTIKAAANAQAATKSEFTFVDLFAGIGGIAPRV